MNEEFEKMRTEFEAWLTTFDGAQVNLNRADFYYGGPHYASAMTNRAWAAWQASRKQALDAAIAECEKLATLAEEDATLENDERFLVYAKKYRRCSEAIRALQKE